MERTELLRRLEEVEQLVSNEVEMIARHRKTLAELDAKEVDTHTIQIMLVGLESLLVSHFEELEKLRRMFAELERHSQGTTNN
jgi:hypothetical protein